MFNWIKRFFGIYVEKPMPKYETPNFDFVQPVPTLEPKVEEPKKTRKPRAPKATTAKKPRAPRKPKNG